jgi:hypothetical protein
VVIKRALKACEENGRAVSEHFVQSYKMSKTGQGGKRSTEDVLLSRYAAYLVVMNGDPKMPAHFQVGRIVRKAIAEAGGVMPEDMPVPEKSIQQIQREEQQRLNQGPQLSLFPPEEEQ